MFTSLVKPFHRQFNISVRSFSPNFKEIKVLLNGNTRQFENLEKWMISDNETAVAKWVAPDDNPFGLPGKSYSWGVWTNKFPQLTIYRIHKPAGDLIKYRFDVIENLIITQDFVSFNDLLLDGTIYPKDLNKVILEDEDEVEEAVKENKLTNNQIQTIHQTRDFLLTHTSEITKHVDQLIDTAIFNRNNNGNIHI